MGFHPHWQRAPNLQNAQACFPATHCTKVRLPPMAKVFGYAKSATTASKSSLALRFPRAATPKTYANGSAQAIPPNRLPVGSPEPASAVEHGNGDTWKLVGIACTFKTLDGCNDDGFTLIKNPIFLKENNHRCILGDLSRYIHFKRLRLVALFLRISNSSFKRYRPRRKVSLRKEVSIILVNESASWAPECTHRRDLPQQVNL